MSAVRYEIDQDGIATVVIDMSGAVNVMNGEFSDAMSAVVAQLAEERDLIGVVLASGKKTFFAGGDVKGMAAAPGVGFNEQITRAILEGRTLFRSLEKLKVPVVAAINGAALGGGYELTLACNYRIAWDDKSVLIGLPESTLGLLPGGGGCVRMAKKFGLQKALPYLLSGISMPAAEALKQGLVDEIVSDIAELVPRGKAWILQNKSDPLAGTQPWDRPGYKIPGGDISDPVVRGFINQMAFKLFEETRGLLPNKQLIFDIAVESVKLDFDAALKIEARGLVTLIVSPIGKNMMSANFFQSTAVRRGGSRPKEPARSRVDKLGIIGTGDDARAFAEAAEAAGISAIVSTKSQDLAKCDLFIGASEDASGLATTFAKASPDSVWCAIAYDVNAQAAFGGRYVRLHAAPRGPNMKVVEVARAEESHDEAVAKAYDFVQQIKRTPIVIADKGVSFVRSVQARQLLEGVRLLAEGVTPPRIENLGKAIGLQRGPLATIDQIGVDQAAALASRDADAAALRVLQGLIDKGRLGVRAGAGFYDYAEQNVSLSREILQPASAPAPINDTDIKDRLLFSAIVESLNLLEAGVPLSVAEANIAMLNAIDAPLWTGGYIQFVNTFGLDRFVARCAELAAKYGERFAPPKIVKAKLEAAETFT